MNATIHNRMTENFVRLSTEDSILDARKELANRPGAVAAILNDKGQPVTVVRDKDIKNLNASDERPLADFLSQLPIGVVVKDNIQDSITMADFVDPEHDLIDHGERGAMILDEKDQLIGILTKEAIDRYLDEGVLMRGFPSDNQLPGRIDMEFILYCDEFNHPNRLEPTNYDPDNLPDCQVKYPRLHPIRIRN